MTNGDNDSSPIVGLLNAKSLESFFGDNPKTLLAIGNGIERRSKIKKSFPVG